MSSVTPLSFRSHRQNGLRNLGETVSSGAATPVHVSVVPASGNAGNFPLVNALVNTESGVANLTVPVGVTVAVGQVLRFCIQNVDSLTLTVPADSGNTVSGGSALVSPSTGALVVPSTAVSYVRFTGIAGIVAGTLAYDISVEA
jgi:hypothetical protein